MNFNNLYNKYENFVNNIAIKYNYDDNIKHLLTVILVLFITKYGLNKESIILNCFNDVKIIFENVNSSNGFFYRELYIENNQFYSKKYIVIDNKKNYIELIDTFIHEFNHAINSYNNEIKVEDNYILLRTGLSYIKYDKKNVKKAISKSKEYVLEEILNTKQSEQIIDIAKNINLDEIDNLEIYNFIKTIKQEIFEEKYKSQAYLLETTINEKLLNNKTFINTLQNLRLDGDIENIENWFDNIIGEKGSYDKYNVLLEQLIELEEDFVKKKFKYFIKYKIKKTINELRIIVNKFDNYIIYK